MITLPIAHTWDGTVLHADQRAVAQLDADGPWLRLRVFAPFHDDPPPDHPPGPTPGLWNHEVVELFLAGPDARYLELELGPHGHHLVLALKGIRNPIRQAMPMKTATRRCGTRWWSGEARFPVSWLPPEPHTANAYRIHGTTERTYLTHTPTLGDAPDFHRLERFVPVTVPTQPSPASEAIAAALETLRPGATSPVAEEGFEGWHKGIVAGLNAP